MCIKGVEIFETHKDMKVKLPYREPELFVLNALLEACVLSGSTAEGNTPSYEDDGYIEP